MFALISSHKSLVDSFSTLGDEYFDDLLEFLHTKLPHLIVIAICAWLLVRLLNLILNRVIRLAERNSGRGGNLSQVKTLTSVGRATGIGVISFLAILQILPILGFNLGPLLTSAGVAGVAIGLAAQTIVKDCLNGFLVLIEDQYNVGDKVTLAGLTGRVETMSLRKTQVRADDGTLYVIPNSQITTVANLTRDFSVATIPVSVDFSANPDEVMNLLKEVAMSVRNDPAYSDVYLADPNLLGVDAIRGSQVIYPVQLRTLPNQQWAAMRETQRRIRIALAEHGMLPGDPLRVYTAAGDATTGQVHPSTLTAGQKVAADPTTAKPNEVNPFTGEGL